MKYMGSKRRIASEILPIILKGRGKSQTYVEPFCGGLNTLSLVEGARLGGDSHMELIAFYKDLQRGRKFPLFVSEADYLKIKKGRDAGLKGYVGFLFSFAGVYLGPYARSKKLSTFENELRVSNQATKSLDRIREQVEGIDFVWATYDTLRIPANSLVYCDPPYLGTYGYEGSGSKESRFSATRFNHTHFWLWAEKLRRDGHVVYVSEYTAPEYVTKVVWEGEIKIHMDKSKISKTAKEKLYKL